MSGSAFVFIFRILGAASVYLTQIVIARWQGAEVLGAYVYAFSWLILLAVISGFGFPSASFRFIGQALAHNTPAKIRGYVRRGSQVVLGGSLILSLALAYWVSRPDSPIQADYRIPVVIAVLSAPLMAMILFRTSVAQSFSWFDLSVIPQDALRPLTFLLLLVFLWISGVEFNVNQILILQLAVIAFFSVLIYTLVQRRINQHIEDVPPTYESRLWVRTASPLLIIVVFSGYFSELNMIIVGSYLSPEDLAIFNASFRTAFMIGFGITAVDVVTLPKASILFAGQNAQGLQRLITHSTHLKFWGALIAVAVMVFFGKTILSIFGENFVEGYRTLIILGIAMLLIAGTGAVTELLSISGHQDLCLYVYLSAFVLTLLLHATLIPRYGLDGAAYSVLAVVIFYSLWLHWLVIRKMKILPSVFGIFWLRKATQS